MNRSMCITYEVDGGLYVNLTNACPNRCDFCIRNNGDGAYGSDSLWLMREPGAEAVIADVLARDLESYSELVFCGYGEPTERLDCALRVARAVRARRPDMKIRMNTNGQSDLIMGCDSAPLYEGAFDVVSISLNAATAEGYDALCHSVYGLEAFPAILRFAERVKAFVPEVLFTVVGDFLAPEELDACRRLASEIGVPLRVRSYIAPEAPSENK